MRIWTPLLLAGLLAGCGSKNVFEASRRGDLEGLKDFLDKDAALAQAHDSDQFTPLHFAGSRETAELLISKGADVEAQGSLGKTPLQTVASGPAAEALIARGANVNASCGPMNPGMPAVVTQVEDGHPEVVRALLKAGADPKQWTILQEATGRRDRKMVAAILDAGFNANVTDRGGATALHYAAANDDEETAKLLLDKGADPNAPLGDGVTLTESFLGVIKRGDSRSVSGMTPQQLAKSQGMKDLLARPRR